MPGCGFGADAYVNFGGKKKLGELMKLAGLGVPVKVLDSLLHKGAMVKVSALVGPGSATKLDSLGIRVVYNEQQVDSLDTPVTGIQGVYAPISSPDEIGVVSSQVVYFNLQAQLLGSGEWNNLFGIGSTPPILFGSDVRIRFVHRHIAGLVSGMAGRLRCTIPSSPFEEFAPRV